MARTAVVISDYLVLVSPLRRILRSAHLSVAVWVAPLPPVGVNVILIVTVMNFVLSVLPTSDLALLDGMSVTRSVAAVDRLPKLANVTVLRPNRNVATTLIRPLPGSFERQRAGYRP